MAVATDLDALPATAQALFGDDFFAGRPWYRATTAAGLPAAATPVFLTFLHDGRAAAVMPMLVEGHAAASLTTPYSCQWRPLLAPDLDAPTRQAVWRGFAAWCRGFASVRLEALDAGEATAIASAMIGTGLAPLRFDHFGNWHVHAELGWPAYLAGRPGQLREALRRRGKRLQGEGATLRVIATPDSVEDGIAAYEQVYARSWKVPEPFPAFNAALMRECARDGSLRLGLLSRSGEVLAAQFWVVQKNWAAVLKLAHDEAAKALSPGTVLTAMMIEHLMIRDGVTELDFGRGDDPYKQDWTGERRQMSGLVLANPLRPAGLGLMLRHGAGRALRRWRRG